jgi:5-methyltetrahydropteroyltriglutamate--homocysteine methyltransferase
MRRSTERILTTHVGSLVRTREIIEGMKARALNEPYDQAQLASDVRRGVSEVVRKQVSIGIDIPSDGEYGRHSFRGYMNDRLGGLEVRPIDPQEDLRYDVEEQRLFPEFFEQYFKHYRSLWMLPGVSMEGVPNLPGYHERCRVTGPISYTGQASLERNVSNFRDALKNLSVADAFIPADVPTSRWGDRDVLEFYPNEAAYLYAVADAMHEEYKAITDAGFIVQLDLAALTPGRKSMLLESPALNSDGPVRALELGVEVINHALRGVPEERVRYHHCWGSQNQPHTQDAPLKSIVALMFKINAQAYSIEAANPRHEHEWMIWKDVRLPEGKILIPGFISHQTNVVEHPELVAWRIKNYASVIGKENLIAGTDCGFSQHWDSIRVHPSVQWAKLQALVEGAALASRDLWDATSN